MAHKGTAYTYTWKDEQIIAWAVYEQIHEQIIRARNHARCPPSERETGYSSVATNNPHRGWHKANNVRPPRPTAQASNAVVAPVLNFRCRKQLPQAGKGVERLVSRREGQVTLLRRVVPRNSGQAGLATENGSNPAAWGMRRGEHEGNRREAVMPATVSARKALAAFILGCVWRECELPEAGGTMFSGTCSLRHAFP